MTDPNTIGYPDEEPSDDSIYRVQCPACDQPLKFRSLVDLYRQPCKSCGKFCLLYFWGKKESPHLTEDILYILCDEELINEEHLATALETKKQSSTENLIDFLLSIRYVTREELTDLALDILPSPWIEIFEEEETESSDEHEDGKDPLLRSEISKIYEILDQFLEKQSLSPSGIRARGAELILRGLGADLTAQEARTRLGLYLTDKTQFPLSLSENELASSFSKLFDLEFLDTSADFPSPDQLHNVPEELLQKHRVIPVSLDNEILELGFPAHLLILGLGSEFQLSTPQELRAEFDQTISFSIISLETLLEKEKEFYGTAKPALDQPDQTIQEIRTDFHSALESQERTSPESSPVQSSIIRHWLYHPQAKQIIPDIVRQTDLDSLNIWIENQKKAKSEESFGEPPEIPPEDEDEFETLQNALDQLYKKGRVFPHTLDISLPTLEEITDTLAEVYKAVPVANVGNFLWVCVEETGREERLADLSMILGTPIRALKGDGESIVQILVRHYGLKSILEDPDRIIEDQPDVHRLYSRQEVEPNPEAIKLLPAQIALDLDIVPIEETENEVKIACCYPIDFFNRKMLKLMLEKSLRFLRTDQSVIENLQEEYYSVPEVQDTKKEQNGEGNGTISQGESLPLDFHVDELEGLQSLLNQIEEQNEEAPPLNYVTSRRSLLEDPLLIRDKEHITLKENDWTPVHKNLWTPSMTSLFHAIPLRSDHEELEVVASMEYRWILEHLPLFTGIPIQGKLLSQTVMPELQNYALEEMKPEEPEEKQKNESGRFEFPDSSSRMPPVSPEVIERGNSRPFHQLTLLLIWYVLKHNCRLTIESGRENTAVKTGTGEEQETIQLLHKDNAAPLIYRLHLVAGNAPFSLQKEETNRCSFIFQQKRLPLELHSKPGERGPILNIDPK